MIVAPNDKDLAIKQINTTGDEEEREGMREQHRWREIKRVDEREKERARERERGQRDHQGPAGGFPRSVLGAGLSDATLQVRIPWHATRPKAAGQWVTVISTHAHTLYIHTHTHTYTRTLKIICILRLTVSFD
jgi:hypothetical protein